MTRSYRHPRRRRLAVLGSPIAHSKSPALHRAAYEVLDLDWTYEAIEVGDGQLSAFVESLDDTWRGLSLTMPLKRDVLDLPLGWIGSIADQTRSANTLLLDDTGDYSAENTDVAGIVRAVEHVVHIPSVQTTRVQTTPVPTTPVSTTPVQTTPVPTTPVQTTSMQTIPAQTTPAPVPPLRTPPEQTSPTRISAVQILGAGATAASAIVAASELGATSVHLSARSPEKAARLVEFAEGWRMSATAGTLKARPPVDPDLVISTLPGGAATDDVAIESASQRAVLLDVAYDPWPSALAARWEQAGGRVVHGLEMLVEQAIGQIRLFLTDDADAPLPEEARVRAAMRRGAGLPDA